jgi:transketolase
MMNEAISQTEKDRLCVNTIRTLTMDAIQQANSGHPGAPMGLAPAGYVLWTQFLKHSPSHTLWPDRDRFVLSGGHASMLLYSLLHLTGYELSLEDIQSFRQWKSKTPGHPEYGITPGVETSTGPLGQGFGNAVGMAMAEQFLAATFNRPNFSIVDHYTYVMCGDGDLMEGISSESASLAGHLGLSKLICLYDSNSISIEGSTDITFTEDVACRFKAFNWHVQKVENGNDPIAIGNAIAAAKDETTRPSIIIIHTTIAYGSPNKQGSADAHGAPLGEEEVRLTKQCLECSLDECFCVPDIVYETCSCKEKGHTLVHDWQALFHTYTQEYPDQAKEWEQVMSGKLPEEFSDVLPDFRDKIGESIATRAASGITLNAIAKVLPTLIGGSADLAPSNKTFINDMSEFQKGHYNGRNIRFGVREHAMGAILNGLALHRGIRPFGGTFMVFSDYMRPAIRMAALMEIPVIYVFTHDSIAVGEDGPTHQPVEHLAALRAIPGLTVIRPADATETAQAWKVALRKQDGPTALILSRQKLPVINRDLYPSATQLSRGAYVLTETEKNPQAIILASGSEISLAMSACKVLSEKGIAVRLISLPSFELLDSQARAYIDEILLPHVKPCVVVEAGVPMGWRQFAGAKASFICMNSFGASAPGEKLQNFYGFTIENIVDCVIDQLRKYS